MCSVAYVLSYFGRDVQNELLHYLSVLKSFLSFRLKKPASSSQQAHAMYTNLLRFFVTGQPTKVHLTI